MRVAASRFAARETVEQVEEGFAFAPKFDTAGLISVIVMEAGGGDVLMLGQMNAQALELTLSTGEMHYWSRSRQALWRKGQTSGLVQRLVELRVDDDQDALIASVTVAGSGASCHVGYHSCFYRALVLDPSHGEGERPMRLRFTEDAKIFDPVAVYGDLPNPTQL
ncbi:phosphoribosyl-AMP cyclohydrolase [Bosea vaviloviae]|uniref:Histidine biosynthesis bifunctional protein HisIE n=1 Tax=Bosea vaviloviae TaxID=1526658 RepID=A0A1D7UCF2_9HYPH|nr:phosphoribosyl-AMP cyclohydrolase [Bosea vaviloviae]AOO85053.1 phosphoribosyl-AMP cyclohydrolase [Bosea vaviloviae]